jgi:hypothetical protein
MTTLRDDEILTVASGDERLGQTADADADDSDTTDADDADADDADAA